MSEAATDQRRAELERTIDRLRGVLYGGTPYGPSQEVRSEMLAELEQAFAEHEALVRASTVAAVAPSGALHMTQVPPALQRAVEVELGGAPRLDGARTR